MIRKFALAAVLAAAGLFSISSFARAGDDAPAPAAPAAPAAEAPKAEPSKAEQPKSETKTPSPIMSVMFWLGHQVAPNMECACPAKSAEGEKAWRDWFAGGKDVPAAAIRDALVADGWNADRFVQFFKDMVAKQAAHAAANADKSGTNADAVKGGAGADGKGKDCGGGACHGEGGKSSGKAKGEGCGSDCHGKCPGCPGDCPDKAKKEKPETPAAPTETPAKP